MKSIVATLLVLAVAAQAQIMPGMGPNFLGYNPAGLLPVPGAPFGVPGAPYVPATPYSVSPIADPMMVSPAVPPPMPYNFPFPVFATPPIPAPLAVVGGPVVDVPVVGDPLVGAPLVEGPLVGDPLF